jgi:putative DNA primase/helicase
MSGDVDQLAAARAALQAAAVVAVPVAADAASAAPLPPSAGANEDQSSHLGGWRSGGGGERGPGAAEADERAAFLPRTDLGNAERWQLRHGQDFRYCPELGWLAWDGRRWSREDADARLIESIFETVRAIQHEADWLAEAGRAHLDAGGAAADSPDQVVRTPARGPVVMMSDALRSWGRTSEGGGKIYAIAQLAETLVSIKMNEFDADPWKLNVLNGTLVLDRGDKTALWDGGPDHEGRAPAVSLQPFRREDMITMLAPVIYDPRAACVAYDAFMARVQPDAEVRDFLHAWAGYSLTGDASEQKFVINHGAQGANGKSTWIDTLAEIMGDYAIAVNIAVFMDEKIRSGSSPSPDLAELPRKRMVRTSEPPRGAPFAEALVKLVTGGEPLPARQLNKPFFRFNPEFKITVSMNPVPQLSDDPAIWRRTRVVPWDVTIPEAERDAQLKDKLAVEASGILNRMLAGFLMWAAHGLPETAKVAAATQQIRDSLDPLGKFLKAACVIEPDARAGSSQLFEVFKAWALWAGEKEWSQIGFSKALANRGFDKIQSNTMHYLGLRLVRGVDDFVDRIEGRWVPREKIGAGSGPPDGAFDE